MANKYWLRRWAKYLEQPDLKQATGALSTGNRKSSPKCCLGHAEFMLGHKFKKSKEFCGWVLQNKPYETKYLSDETQAKFGITAVGRFRTSVFVGGLEYTSLTAMNDCCIPLKVIAKVIRENMDNFQGP